MLDIIYSKSEIKNVFLNVWYDTFKDIKAI